MFKLDSYLSVTQRLQERVTPRISPRALRQGFIILSTSLVGNLIQYGFHFFAGRMLGPTEYGILASLLALAAILTVPTGIAQTVFTQYVAGFYARGQLDRISRFISDGTVSLSLACLALFICVAVASPLISAFMNIASDWPVVAMGTFLIFAGPLTSFTGAVQGLQRFQAIAAQSVLGPGFRLVAAVILVGIGFGASGALGATAISNALVLGLTALFLRDLPPRSHDHGLSLSQIWNYSGMVLAGTIAFAMLTNVDLVIVKHFFSPAEAGYYSAASVLGKTVLAFPGAVAILMFPKSSFRYALGESASDLARISVLVTVGLCAGAAVLLYVFQTPITLLMYGREFEASAPLVGLYGATMGVYAVVQLLLAFYISQQDSRFAWLLVSVTAALSVFLIFVHASLVQVILSLASVAVFIIVFGEIWLGGLGILRPPRLAPQ